MRIETRFDGSRTTFVLHMKRNHGFSETIEYFYFSPEDVAGLRPIDLIKDRQEQIHLFWFPPAARWIAICTYNTDEGTAGLDEHVKFPTFCSLEFTQNLPITIGTPNARAVDEATGNHTLFEKWMRVYYTSEGLKLYFFHSPYPGYGLDPITLTLSDVSFTAPEGKEERHDVCPQI